MRVTPDLLTYASFGGESTDSSCAGNGGMVLDVSESGMAVAAALAMCEGVLVSITVPGDATHPVIDLRGRVVRVTESKRRVGVRFEELSANNRELLRGWILALGGLVSSGIAELLPALPPNGSAADPDGSARLDVDDLIEDKVGAASGLPEAVTMERITARAEVEEVAPPTSLGRPSLERPRLGPSVVRTFPTPPPKPGEAIQPPQRSRSTLPPTVAVHPAPALGVKSVAAELGNRQANLPALGVAILLVVILCFGLGIAIGRSVLRWRAHQLVSSGSSSSTPEPALSAVASETGERTESLNAASAAKVAAISKPAPTGGSDLTSRAASDAGIGQIAASSTAAAAPRFGSASEIAPRGTTTGQRVTANSEASVAAARRDAASEGPSALPATGTSETIVTPNEGASPLRVELSEEILVQTASLEIRSRRFALVPGAAPSRSHKLRKERLVMGRLISRVTPQVPTSGLETGAGGKQVVTVRATIAADGHVSYVDPLSGPIALMPVVMSAVREWKYEPSSLDGDPFSTQVDLVIQFGSAR